MRGFQLQSFCTSRDASQPHHGGEGLVIDKHLAKVGVIFFFRRREVDADNADASWLDDFDDDLVAVKVIIFGNGETSIKIAICTRRQCDLESILRLQELRFRRFAGEAARQ